MKGRMVWNGEQFIAVPDDYNEAQITEVKMAKKKKRSAVKKADPKKVELASRSAVEAASEEFRKNILVGKEKSRNHLMDEVRARGIKNFRVMNKAELAEIVEGAKADRIAEIQKQAVERWKSGWGKEKVGAAGR